MKITTSLQTLLLEWAKEEFAFGEDNWILVGKVLALPPNFEIDADAVYPPEWSASEYSPHEAYAALSDIWGSPLGYDEDKSSPR